VQSCFIACTVKQLFSVLYGVVRAVHGFDFRLVTNETYNNWPPVKEGRSVTTLMSLTGSIFFLWQ